MLQPDVAVGLTFLPHGWHKLWHWGRHHLSQQQSGEGPQETNMPNSRNVLENKKNLLRDKNRSRDVGLKICSLSLKKRGMLTYWKIMNWGLTRGLFPSSPVICFTLGFRLVTEIKNYCEIRIIVLLNPRSMLVHKPCKTNYCVWYSR